VCMHAEHDAHTVKTLLSMSEFSGFQIHENTPHAPILGSVTVAAVPC